MRSRYPSHFTHFASRPPRGRPRGRAATPYATSTSNNFSFPSPHITLRKTFGYFCTFSNPSFKLFLLKVQCGLWQRVRQRWTLRGPVRGGRRVRLRPRAVRAGGGAPLRRRGRPVPAVPAAAPAAGHLHAPRQPHLRPGGLGSGCGGDGCGLFGLCSTGGGSGPASREQRRRV